MNLFGNLVVAPRGPVAQRGEDRGRERRLALLALRALATDAAGAGQESVCEREYVGGRFGEERAELDGEDCLRRDDKFGLPALARRDYLARGTFGLYREDRQTVAD